VPHPAVQRRQPPAEPGFAGQEAEAVSGVRALAVIDGEHYPAVVRDALAALPYEFAAAWLAGGTEKLREGEEYGVPLVRDLEDGLASYRPEVVVDLSDEPVLGPRERFLVASRVLAAGLPYAGPDFRLDPPLLAPFPRPSLGIVGTGKRVGKTAIAGHVARLLSTSRRVVVVAMGRGGPSEPEVVAEPPSLEQLLERSRAGRHAASDHLEDAALTAVPAVGASRCGGGLAGAAARSNVADAAEAALGLDPELVVFEGSGAALPPIATGRRILVASALQPALVTAYLNAYRVLVSDLVVAVGEDGSAIREAVQSLKDVPVVTVLLRPRPVEPVAGRRIAYFCTAPESALEEIAAHLARKHGADVAHVSGGLADRRRLRAELVRVDADVFVTELKAAAIDVVAEEAAVRGVPLMLAGNEVVPVDGDLDAAVSELADAVATEGVIRA
jgi:cyclic 2,3-diphosphoglycerate synthetase